MEYSFIGGGNMGRAMATALIGRGVCLPGEILVVEPDEANRKRMADLGCAVIAEPSSELGKGGVLVLAVKPQVAAQVMAQIKPHMSAAQVVVSIMAGVTIARVREALDHALVVRVMPNTPAQVGLGMNVYIATPEVSAKQLKAVVALLDASGESMAVGSEDAIDAATAVSGSGPAYVFHLAEHWTQAARDLGFTPAEADRLVQQTLVGATVLWRSMDKSPATLREQVTSKGGTTAAALEHLNQQKAGEAMREAINKAYQRAKELGR